MMTDPQWSNQALLHVSRLGIAGYSMAELCERFNKTPEQVREKRASMFYVESSHTDISARKAAREQLRAEDREASYLSGKAARIRGDDIDVCPAELNFQRQSSWRAGWHDADMAAGVRVLPSDIGGAWAHD